MDPISTPFILETHRWYQLNDAKPGHMSNSIFAILLKFVGCTEIVYIVKNLQNITI